MMPFEDNAPLPPVRRMVFLHSLLIVGIYITIGIFMMIAIYSASRITPKAIKSNYTSIAASARMGRAWNGIKTPSLYPQLSLEGWIREFEAAISYEETNITEPGEDQLSRDIRSLWEEAKKELKAHREINQTQFIKLDREIDRLAKLNEKALYGWVTESNHFAQWISIVILMVFLLTIAVVFYLTDQAAMGLATPLRELSAALKRRPQPGSKLKLPPPTTLEMGIINHELLDLWHRVSELQKLNLGEITAQRRKLEAVLESVEDAILVLNNQELILHCNEGMSRILESPLQEMVNRPWRDLSIMTPNYLKLREVLRPEISSEQQLDLQVGVQSRIFAGRCRTIVDERNEHIGRLYLLHDITEIKQRKRLQSEFIGVLSHEIKTPLQSLGTASELLLERKDLLDEEGRMLLETIHEDVGRIRGVANEFVQVGLIDLHSLLLKIEEAPLDQLIQQWIRPFQVLAKDRNIKIEFLREGAGQVMTRIDTVKFPWVITNLLSNAIRVSPQDSTVTVFLTIQEGKERQVLIEVRDEGPGIAEDIQKRMFEPFFQGEREGQEKLGGFLGLGLTITKEVVEAHEGKIVYLPRLPKGSVFRICLPLASNNQDEGKIYGSSS